MAQMTMMRHVGKLKHTDSRCVVVMMQIPGREDHALIVESDSLPDHYHQSVMACLESREGQSAESFASELGRRQIFITNKGNMSIMQALHEAGFLRPVHIDNVLMTPHPSSAFPLRHVLEQMSKNIPGEKFALDPKNAQNPEKFNPYGHNIAVNNSEERVSAAKGLLLQASLLETDSKKLKEQAYSMAPELRPQLKANIQPQTTATVDGAPTKRSRGRPTGSTKKSKDVA